MYRALASLAALAVLFGLAAAEEAPKSDRVEPAPLGLTWGMSKADVSALGVEFSNEDEGAAGQQAIARKVPRALADAEVVYLFFGFDDRLWRVFVASREWRNDDYGSQATARFDELAAMLDQKYGPGEAAIYEPRDDLYSEPDRFAMSLSMNKRFHARTWKAGQVAIELAIKADFTSTFYTLAYELMPLAEKARQGQKDREKGAL